MSPDRIKYSLEVNGAEYHFWITAEAPIASHETFIEEWNKLRQQVHEAVGLAMPPIIADQPKPPAEINIAKDRTEILIENAKTIEELQSISTDAYKYGLYQQWSDKHIRLTKHQNNQQ